MSKENEYKDFISFLDDKEEKRDLWVRILKIKDSYVMFKLKSGKVITIPTHRILKIKQDGDGINEANT